MSRGEWAFWIVCLAAGGLFFASLGNLWPLADADLTVPLGRVQSDARAFLDSQGYDLDGYRSAALLTVETAALDYVERTFGREQTQEWIAAGLPLVYYRAYFKRRAEPIWYTVSHHPEIGAVGWAKRLPEDHAGARIPVDEARLLAQQGLTLGLGLELARFEERSVSTTEAIEQRTHRFGFETVLSEEPELRERVTITVAGDEVAAASRRLVVPQAAGRAARAAEAPGVALETIGIGLLVAFMVAAFFIFLRRLRAGSVDLLRASIWPVLVFVCLLGTDALETAGLFRYWEPLWPQWISNLRYLVFSAIRQVWWIVVLLAVVAAGDALDREQAAGRGRALWALARGRLFDPLVARASRRGFMVGLLCGGVMALAVLLLQTVVGSRTVIQPRGFFFYTLNSAAPALTSLLFFFGVALAEELGYRFFAGSWLMRLTGRRWLAILLPAVIYGLAHTNLDFLPPANPFWARALVLTLVGCVWGWAFFRYDALTVVLSHFTADLFIFNWPRLASGDTAVVVTSVLVICVPLIPAALAPLRRGQVLA